MIKLLNDAGILKQHVKFYSFFLLILILIGCVSTESENFDSLVHNAIVSGNKKTMQTTLFIVATSKSNPDYITRLLNAGANVNARNSNNPKLPALMFAVLKNPNLDIIIALLNGGANINFQDENGITPLMTAHLNANPEIIPILLGAGANVNARDKNGYTALMWAVENWGVKNNTIPDFIIALLNGGVDVNIRDKDGITPLIKAASFIPNPDIINILIDAGANINDHALDGFTPLMQASILNPNSEIISTLIDAGANINYQAPELDGMTALMLAGINPNSCAPEIITILLNAGADPKIKNTNGETAFDYAKDNEYIKGSDVYWELNNRRF